MNQVKRMAILSSLVAVLLLAHLGLNAQSQKELNDAASSDDTWLITNKDYAGHRFVSRELVSYVAYGLHVLSP